MIFDSDLNSKIIQDCQLKKHILVYLQDVGYLKVNFEFSSPDDLGLYLVVCVRSK